MPTQPLDVDYYMACLNLRDQPVLVVGGGSVGLEKIEGLLAADADVLCVSIDVVPRVRDLAAHGAIGWKARPYETDDLDGRFLVVAATSDTSLNRRIHADAQARRMLVNVVDVPELCNFILPAVVREGPIAIAISTSGASPALAKRLKRETRELLRPSHAHLARMLNDVRDWAKEHLPTYDDRKRFFESIVNGDPDPVRLLDEGRVAEVEAAIVAAQERFAVTAAPAGRNARD